MKVATAWIWRYNFRISFNKYGINIKKKSPNATEKKVLSAQHLTGNAIHQKMPRRSPCCTPTPIHCPKLPHPASGGIFALRFLICFSALTLVGEREKKKAQSSALEKQGRGHGYWCREEVRQAAWLYWIFCYRGAIGERKKEKKHSEQKNLLFTDDLFS